MVEEKKKREYTGSTHGDPHEEGLGIEPLVELNDLHRLVEHGVDEHVSGSVPVNKLIKKKCILYIHIYGTDF